MAKTTLKHVANKFSAIIREWLDEGELAEVNAKNATVDYRGFCATHEYCDPNVAMDIALRNFGLDMFYTSPSLVSKIWVMAKDNKFKYIR